MFIAEVKPKYSVHVKPVSVSKLGRSKKGAGVYTFIHGAIRRAVLAEDLYGVCVHLSGYLRDGRAKALVKHASME